MPQNIVMVAAYLAIFLIFFLDVVYRSEILLQVFYFLPLVAISFHCERVSPVVGAVVITFILQVAMLLTYHMSVTSTIIEMSMVLWSDVLVASVSRYARTNMKVHVHDADRRVAKAEWHRERRGSGITTNHGKH